VVFPRLQLGVSSVRQHRTAGILAKRERRAARGKQQPYTATMWPAERPQPVSLSSIKRAGTTKPVQYQSVPPRIAVGTVTCVLQSIGARDYSCHYPASPRDTRRSRAPHPHPTAGGRGTGPPTLPIAPEHRLGWDRRGRDINVDAHLRNRERQRVLTSRRGG